MPFRVPSVATLKPADEQRQILSFGYLAAASRVTGPGINLQTFQHGVTRCSVSCVSGQRLGHCCRTRWGEAPLVPRDQRRLLAPVASSLTRSRQCGQRPDGLPCGLIASAQARSCVGPRRQPAARCYAAPHAVSDARIDSRALTGQKRGSAASSSSHDASPHYCFSCCCCCWCRAEASLLGRPQ